MSEHQRFQTYVRETVTITRPMPSVYTRGVGSDAEDTAKVSVRIQYSVVDELDQASRLLGMTRGAFIRWCAHQAAIDILKQHKQFKKLAKD